MKYLIFGKNGQVSYELARDSAAKPGKGAVIALGSNEADFSKPEGVLAKIREVRPDVVINASAFTKVDLAESPDQKELVLQVNATTPGLIAEECKRLGALFVHYSTDYVFGGGGVSSALSHSQPHNHRDPITEEAQPSPINFYGLSKLKGEQNIHATGCDHLIFRISWVYADRGQNFFRSMLNLGKSREVLKIVDDQIGAPTWAQWVAQATWDAIGDTDVRSKLGLYHLSPEGQTSWFGFASEIFQQIRQHHAEIELKLKELLPIPTSEYPTPAKRPLYSKMSSDKFRASFPNTGLVPLLPPRSSLSSISSMSPLPADGKTDGSLAGNPESNLAWPSWEQQLTRMIHQMPTEG